jgi:hypothetical protein
MSLHCAMNKVCFPRSLVAWMAILAAGMAAVGYAADKAPPAPANADDLFTNSVVPHLQLEISREGMEVLEKYRQVWGKPRPERIDVKATVRVGKAVYTNVAVHLKGSYTFQGIDEKPSLTLNFDKFTPGQRFHGLDKIHLNNSVQDPSYLCEKLAREMFVAAGVPATRIGHARVSLNDRALGFYVLVEGYNKRFLKRHFKSTKGNLYDGGSGGDISKALEVDSGGEPENRADLTALFAATREPNAAKRYARLEQLLDVDRFLTFAALEVLLQHWDGYCLGPNNFRLFHDADRDRMVFLPHGMDQIFGRGQSPSASITPNWDGLVARALFTTPKGRQRYLERFGQVFTNHFRIDDLIARVDELAKKNRPWAGSGFFGGFQNQSAVDELKGRIVRREQYVREQLENPEKPVVFGKDGELRLTSWQFKRPSRDTVKGPRGRHEDRNTLEVQINGGNWSSGSWRKLVLLDAGHYELSGLARVAGLPAGATNSGVILRVSGERESTGLSTNAGWTPLQYEFELPGLINAELVCEFRGPEGAGMFDVSSLKLRRKGPLTLPQKL